MVPITMEVPHGSERFTFPARPSSPPATPGSTRSRNTSATSYTAIQDNKRHGFINFGISPPENLEPRGLEHQFSYTPPNRENSSSDSSACDDVEPSDDEVSILEKQSFLEEELHDDASERRPSVIRQIDEGTDFTVEELSENDIGYDTDTEIVRPDQTEDAESDKDETDVGATHEKDLIDSLKNLHCDPEAQEKAQEFEEAQLSKYRQRKKRWSIGGKKKRSHAQSVGSDSSDNADIELLEDFHQLGASARRLRRRTQGPADGDRPSRTSLLFDDPPAEIEELRFVDTLDPPALISDSDDDLEEDSSSDEEGSLTDGEDMLVPSWLMDVDSDHSRPSTPT
jgi:hypothetical protein